MKSFIKLILLTFVFIYSGTFMSSTFAQPYRLEKKVLEKVVKTSISNLEINPELYRLDPFIFFQAIQTQVYLAASQITGGQELEQTFYGIAMYFVATHFGREKLAETLLLEERKYADDPLFRGWIDNELLKLQRKLLYKNVGIFGRTLGFSRQMLEEPEIFNEETFMAIPASIEVETSSNTDQDVIDNSIRASSALKNMAEKQVAEGKLKSAVQNLDQSAEILAAPLKGSKNYPSPYILTARQIADLGLSFAAIIRYKRILQKCGDSISNEWKVVIHEDLGDIYSKLKLKEQALTEYNLAIEFSRENNIVIERILQKVNY